MRPFSILLCAPALLFVACDPVEEVFGPTQPGRVYDCGPIGGHKYVHTCIDAGDAADAACLPDAVCASLCDEFWTGDPSYCDDPDNTQGVQQAGALSCTPDRDWLAEVGPSAPAPTYVTHHCYGEIGWSGTNDDGLSDSGELVAVPVCAEVGADPAEVGETCAAQCELELGVLEEEWLHGWQADACELSPPVASASLCTPAVIPEPVCEPDVIDLACEGGDCCGLLPSGACDVVRAGEADAGLADDVVPLTGVLTWGEGRTEIEVPLEGELAVAVGERCDLDIGCPVYVERFELASTGPFTASVPGLFGLVSVPLESAGIELTEATIASIRQEELNFDAHSLVIELTWRTPSDLDGRVSRHRSTDALVLKRDGDRLIGTLELGGQRGSLELTDSRGVLPR